MAKHDAPTRSNYLDIQDSLKRVRRSRELLERKRQILMVELMDKVETMRNLREQVEEQLNDSFERLGKAARRAGSERLVRESLGFASDTELEVRPYRVMGVTLPDIDLREEQKSIPYGLVEGGSGMDEVRQRFNSLLKPLVRLAASENAAIRLAEEIKRTRRRISAMDNTYIPRYKKQLGRIADALEERKREEMIIMKKAKEKKQKRATPGGGNASSGRRGNGRA
ncbi:MAG: V-type ATP synthase subunit D [Candidatus Brocadiia bacterium]